MKKIVVFDTSYGTFNMGDFIIVDSANKELKFLIENNFVVRVGTHNPVSHFYQTNSKRKITQYFYNADYKFLLGTNIIKQNMFHPWPDWNVNIFNCKYYKGTLLVGAGIDGKRNKINKYSKILYKKILNKEYYHSTRDEETKLFLESIGLKAINTGCPTMWSLTEEHCKKIPTKKSKKVVFTLTDYRQNYENDQLLIDILNENYEELFFWIQGAYDYEYIKKFRNIDKIKFIAPSLDSYREFLENNEVDYVGTRLHAGIFALKNFKRTIIIIVDNRARDMKLTYNLPTIERDDVESDLSKIINSDIITSININTKNIKKWKNQFEK